MDFRETYQKAFRSSTGIEELKRIAERDILNFSGKQFVKLVGALLFNANACGCEDEIQRIVMQDLFEKECIYEFKLSDFESIISCIISCGYSEQFVRYMEEFDDGSRDDEWYRIAEKYNLLEAEYCYENEEEPTMIELDSNSDTSTYEDSEDYEE